MVRTEATHVTHRQVRTRGWRGWRQPRAALCHPREDPGSDITSDGRQSTSSQEALHDQGLPLTPASRVGKGCEGREAGGRSRASFPQTFLEAPGPPHPASLPTQPRASGAERCPGPGPSPEPVQPPPSPQGTLRLRQYLYAGDSISLSPSCTPKMPPPPRLLLSVSQASQMEHGPSLPARIRSSPATGSDAG